MKSIALIHTVKSVASGFDDSLRNYLGYEVKIHNLWDDFLANNPNEIGEFTIQNRNRLFCDMKAQELTGADIQVPVIAIDDAMARRIVLYGKRIMVMATAESTVGPTVSKIKAEADKAGREADISTCVCMDAFFAMKAMDMKKHDMILREKAGELKGYDCIVLAQASMAHLEDETASITGCPVLTSPRLCMEEIKKKLEEI